MTDKQIKQFVADRYGGTECLNAIKASMTPEQYKGFLKGNVEKYIWRYSEKGGVQDLQKAQTYLTWLIEEESGDGKTQE